MIHRDEGHGGPGHHHAHGHGHAGHHHAHAPADFGFAFAVATVLNVALVAAQVVFGLMANSIALLADAGHNFGDVLGLLLAWGAHVVARWRPTERFTYGFRSASILSALLNAVTLLVASGAIAWEAIGRLPNPGEVGGLTVMVVAGIGLVINGISAWLLMGGRGDLNVRGAFLHLAADAAPSCSRAGPGSIRSSASPSASSSCGGRGRCCASRRACRWARCRRKSTSARCGSISKGSPACEACTTCTCGP
jgi:cobalt-zinc-cadmium efflux system protein